MATLGLQINDTLIDITGGSNITNAFIKLCPSMSRADIKVQANGDIKITWYPSLFRSRADCDNNKAQINPSIVNKPSDVTITITKSVWEGNTQSHNDLMYSKIKEQYIADGTFTNITEITE